MELSDDLETVKLSATRNDAIDLDGGQAIVSLPIVDIELSYAAFPLAFQHYSRQPRL
jgi:hypothetical protein